MAVDATALLEKLLAAIAISFGDRQSFRFAEGSQKDFERIRFSLVESEVRHAGVPVVFRWFTQESCEGEGSKFVCDLTEADPLCIALRLERVAADAALLVKHKATSLDRRVAHRDSWAGR